MCYRSVATVINSGEMYNFHISTSKIYQKTALFTVHASHSLEGYLKTLPEIASSVWFQVKLMHNWTLLHLHVWGYAAFLFLREP